MPSRAAARLARALLAVVPVAAVGQVAGGALVGDWRLDPARTHYGPGVERRRWERFTCAARAAALACRITGEREGGRRVTGGFAATPGGGAAPVYGIAGVDAVRVRAVSPTVVDATFYARGTPVYGYRAYRSGDGRALVVVAVDPASRAALTTVVVYHRGRP